MQLNTISFCEKTGYNVCSNDYKQGILDELKTRFDVTSTDKSVRMYDASRHKIVLQRHPYFMSIKSIGNTYFLYLTRHKGIPTTFLIDRKILRGYSYPRIIMVRYRFADYLYRGTLIEGDLIKPTTDATPWKFVWSDLLIKGGIDVRTRPFPSRVETLRKILENDYIRDPYLEVTDIRVKQYFPYNEIGVKNITAMLSTANYKIQGVCFTNAREMKPSLLICIESRQSAPVSEARKLAKQARQTKHDPSTEGIFHLYIGPGHSTGLYQLYCSKMGKIIKHSIARIDGLQCLKFVRSVCKDENRVMVECEYNDNFEKFVPKSVSTRTTPDEYTLLLAHTKEKQ